MNIEAVKSRLRPIKHVIFRTVKGWFQRDHNRFLREVSGVVHVGANTGQERDFYNKLGLDVLWIEPIPDVFKELEMNIRPFKKQMALEALLTDTDDEEYEFYIANNHGASSSILKLKEHKHVWPDVDYSSSTKLRSVTLASLFEHHHIASEKYQALIMDTQGSELLVLKGAEPLLSQFKYIKTEVADFEAYEGCCKVADIEAFLKMHGFLEISRRAFGIKTIAGDYFDITYQREP